MNVQVTHMNVICVVAYPIPLAISEYILIHYIPIVRGYMVDSYEMGVDE